MYKKNKNKTKDQRKYIGKKERGDVFKCPPTKPTSYTNQKHVPTFTLLQPPKKSPSSSLHCLKTTMFLARFMWAFWALSWSYFHRENRKTRTFLTSSPILFLPLLFLAYLYFFLTKTLFFSLWTLSFFHIYRSSIFDY